jgi:hypothetical protein
MTKSEELARLDEKILAFLREHGEHVLSGVKILQYNSRQIEYRMRYLSRVGRIHKRHVILTRDGIKKYYAYRIPGYPLTIHSYPVPKEDSRQKAADSLLAKTIKAEPNYAAILRNLPRNHGTKSIQNGRQKARSV